MMDYRAANRYARALFGLARESGETDKIDRSLEAVRKIADEQPGVRLLLLNSTITQKEKEAFVTKILSEDAPGKVLNFLKLLIRKGRFRDFPAVQEEFRLLVEKEKGITEVRAISPAELAPASRDRLLAVLEKKLKSSVRLLTKINPRLIGGLILRFNGMEIDSSFKHRLSEIRQALKT